MDSFAYLEAFEQLELLQDLAAQGIPDSKSAEQIWQILEFPHTTPWRLAALNAYLRVGRRPRRMAELLSDGNPKMREAAAEVVVQEAYPEYLLANLDRAEIQNAFCKGHHILRALVEWSAEEFERLEQRLLQLNLNSPLKQLELSAVRWAGFDDFTPVQQQVATALLRRHRRLPAELVEEVAAGRSFSPRLLEFWEQYPPESEGCRGLAQMLVRVPACERQRVREALERQGEAGARALADLLEDSDVGIAARAAQELRDWPTG